MTDQRTGAPDKAPNGKLDNGPENGPTDTPAEAPSSGPVTEALQTKVEQDFVAPLTAIRGILEILRDVHDLTDGERNRFVAAGLIECDRLGAGVRDLASVVYAADRAQRKAEATDPSVPDDADTQAIRQRIQVHKDDAIIEIDFSHLQFTSAQEVNAFYDVIDDIVQRSGHQWYFIINDTDIRIWPEAWVAYAHRGKKVAVSYAVAIQRYDTEATDPAALRGTGHSVDLTKTTTREKAFAAIEALKQTQEQTR